MYDVNTIKEKLDEGDGNVWRSATTIRKIINAVLSTEPLWSFSHLYGACKELDVKCEFSDAGKQMLFSLLEKIEVPAEEATVNVTGEGSKLFDVDKVLYIVTYMWFVEHNRIISDLERVRMLVEQELVDEEKKIIELQNVRK